MNFANPSYNCVVCFREYALARRNVNPQNASFSCKLSLLSLTKRSRKARNRMVAVGLDVTRTSQRVSVGTALVYNKFGKSSAKGSTHSAETDPKDRCWYRSYRSNSILFIFDWYDVDANCTYRTYLMITSILDMLNYNFILSHLV